MFKRQSIPSESIVRPPEELQADAMELGLCGQGGCGGVHVILKRDGKFLAEVVLNEPMVADIVRCLVDAKLQGGDAWKPKNTS